MKIRSSLNGWNGYSVEEVDEYLDQVTEELEKKCKEVSARNKELEKIKALIETQKKEIEEKDDRLKRLMAEFENFKKRSSKEREGLYNSLIADITSSLLPILDNLEKAVQVKTEDENFKQGIELVLKQFKDVLTSNGVTEIETIGKTFDPELHEAITSVVDENLGPQEIKEEYRKGYMIGNKVIRHSLVVVAN